MSQIGLFHFVLVAASLFSFNGYASGNRPVKQDRVSASTSSPSGGSWEKLEFSSYAPEERREAFTAHVDGKLLVWGGYVKDYLGTNSGGIFDLSSRTWTSTSEVNAPPGRNKRSIILAGQKMIVWGGDPSQSIGTGAIYDLATDSWKTMSTQNAPSGRQWHSMVFTGQELIVFGGRNRFASLSSGARYDLATDTWRPLSRINSPSARHSSSVVWTGQKMIVWGGNLATTSASYNLLNDGAIYDPSSDYWQPLAASSVLSPRADAVAVWSEDRMLLFGGWTVAPSKYGWETVVLNDGAFFAAEKNAWSSIRKPSIHANMTYSYAFSGQELFLWSMDTLGFCDQPAVRFNLASGQWAKISTTSAPVACFGPGVAWTGKQMFVFSGASNVTLREFSLYTP